ncbi:MAG: hypothetical protein ACRELD_04335 [Longimicrobiales bacterium]
MTRQTVLRTALLIGTVFLPVGCAPSFEGHFRDSAARGPDAHPLMLNVRNDHWLPVRLFLVSVGGRQFLGEIAPGARAEYQISSVGAGGAGSLQLIADPLGSADEVMTEPVELGGARWIEWRLKRDLRTSRPRTL